MPELAEAEEFWRTLYPFLFSDESFRIAATEVDRMLELIDFKGGDILDLACGAGRHSLVLAKKGYRVTAVDWSPYLLEKANEKAKADNVEVEFVHGDMRQFNRPEAYDLVLSMCTSFGYFDDKEDDLRTLGNIHRSLKPGGTLVMDLVTKELMARDYTPIVSGWGPMGSFGTNAGEALIEMHDIYDGWSRIRNQWLLVKGDHVRKFEFAHRIYSGQELKDRLEQVGFRNVKLSGDFRGNDYGIKAKRLVVVASK